MKGIPVIKSKLNMPQLPPAILVPDRLRRLSREMYEQQGVIITAPAGYGKTTLMVTALKECNSKGCRVCWYRLDQEDRDPAVFYTHLVEALFPREEGIWAEPHKHLADCPDIFAQHQYLNALFGQELWAFHEQRRDGKTFIVFDDFQQIRGIPEITGAIQFFLDNLPANCTVIISSRCETGLLTGKRRLEKNILAITQRELCFSEDELAAFMKEKYGLIPAQDLLRKIMLHTEGWPAGIILTGQMLTRSSSEEIGFLLDRAGRKELFFQYIMTEVLKTVDAPLLLFLVKAAILGEFTVEEAYTVCGEENAPQFLEKCEENGLFIQKILGPDATYRFHSLFRETLLQIQPRHLSPEEIKRYHRKAAVYALEHRNFSRAIEHFLTCGNIEAAVELVTRESAQMFALEAVEQLRLLFKLLPEEVISGSGHLLYLKSFVSQQRDGRDTLRLLEQALALFRQAKDGFMQIQTLVAMLLQFAQRNDITGMKKIHAQIPALSGTIPGMPREALTALIDFPVTVWEERLSEGLVISQGARALALGDDGAWVASFYSGLLYLLRGDLSQAGIFSKEALSMKLTKNAELLRGFTLSLHSLVLYLQDEQDTLAPLKDELVAIGEKHNYKYFLGFGKRVAALASYRRHDLESALELLEDSTRYFEELGNIPLASSNKLYHCLWQCRQGGINPEPIAGAKKALKALTAAPTGLGLQEIGLSVFGVLAREAGDFKLAGKSLAAAIKSSRAKGARQILAGSCLHLAKLYYDTGDHAKGESFLRQALTLAADSKYMMFWDLHFPTLVEMAARSIKSHIQNGYALALLARYFGREASEFLARTAPLTPDDQFQELTGAFLSRYDTDTSRDGVPSGNTVGQRIRVNLFGKFSITVNDIPIPETEWKTKKISGILKYLLLNRERPVFREQLMDIFWPEAERKLALNSLRAALYELRKVLRKYGVSLEDQGAFLKEKRDNLEVRAGNLLTVDVDLFLKYAGEAKKMPPHREGWTRRKGILEEMLALYRGDLLENDAYEDWVFADREELRSLFFTSALELANIYLQDGDNGKPEKLLLRLLAMDQYNEEACLCLLRLYMATNQRGRAVKFYTDFAGRFEKELRLKPDEKLALVLKEPG